MDRYLSSNDIVAIW